MYRRMVFRIWICILIGLPFLGQSQALLKKTFENSFEVSNGLTVGIENKHGNLNFRHWEKDEVHIEVKLRLEGKKQKQVEKMAEQIEIELEGTKRYVSGRTIIGEDQSIFSKAWRATANMTQELLGTKMVSIDYTIHLPAYAKIEVNNKFGSVFLPAKVNDLKGEISHGDLRGTNIEDLSDLNLEFGKCYLESVKVGNMQLNWAKLYLGAAGNLILKGSSSEYNIKAASVLNVDVKGGELVVDDLQSLLGNTSLTDIILKRVTGEVLMSTKYGSLVVQEVDKDFSSIRLNGSNSDYILNFAQGAGFSFEFAMEKSDQLEFPKDKTRITTLEENEDEKLQVLKGTVGGRTKPNFQVNAKNSSLTWTMR